MPSFAVQGMSCSHCVRAVTAAVHAVDPAARVVVDLAAGRVAVAGGAAAADRLATAIREVGYAVEIAGSGAAGGA